jgi:hypothetical protein
MGEKITAKEILEAGVRQINNLNQSDEQGEQQGQQQGQQVKDKLLLTMAEVYYELAQYPKALDLLSQIKTSSNEQILLQAKIHNILGKFDLALSEIENYNYQANTESVLIYLNIKSQILKDSDQFKQAWSLGDTMLEKAEKLYKKDTEKYADYLYAMSDLNNKTSEYELVLINYLKVLKIYKKAKVSELKTARLYRRISTIYHFIGQIEPSKDYLIKAIKIYQKIYEQNHLIFANLKNNLANREKNEKLFTQAKINYLDAIQIKENFYGPNNWHVATSYYNLGLLFYMDNKQYSKAAKNIIKAINLLESVKEKKMNTITLFKVKLAEIYLYMGNLQDCETATNDAIPYLESLNLKKGRLLAKSRFMLAIIKLKTNKPQEAKALIEQSLPTVKLYESSHQKLLEYFYKTQQQLNEEKT